MLISFSLSNWKSFRDETVFSMAASRERRGSESCARLAPMYGSRRVLPLAALYGANASGKTSLVNALAMLQKLVVVGTQVGQTIPVEGYALDVSSSRKPSRFCIELLKDELIYRYSLVLSRAAVEAEKLEIERTRGDELVFERAGGDVVFGRGFDSERNRFIAEGTRDNQLFLHNAVAQNAQEFSAVFNWFDRVLCIEGVERREGQFSGMLLRPDFQEFVNDRLIRYNTGAVEVVLEPATLASVPIPPQVLDDILRSVGGIEGKVVQLRRGEPGSADFAIYILSAGSGDVNRADDEDDAGADEGGISVGIDCKKVVMRHAREDGGSVRFELSQESGGTQRLIELLPLFFDLAGEPETGGPSERVFVVDELERSFHTAVTHDLVMGFAESCGPESRRQLIFSTHDLLLMDDAGIRRDELWICEKDSGESSSLVCVGRHSGTRTDSRILLNYRSGVYGGYPPFGIVT